MCFHLRFDVNMNQKLLQFYYLDSEKPVYLIFSLQGFAQLGEEYTTIGCLSASPITILRLFSFICWDGVKKDDTLVILGVSLPKSCTVDLLMITTTHDLTLF